MKNKLTAIMRAAAQNGVNKIVLGPLGCGASLNPIAEVAEIMCELLMCSAGVREDWRQSGIVEVVIAIKDDATSKVWNTFCQKFGQNPVDAAVDEDGSLCLERWVQTCSG